MFLIIRVFGSLGKVHAVLRLAASGTWASAQRFTSSSIQRLPLTLVTGRTARRTGDSDFLAEGVEDQLEARRIEVGHDERRACRPWRSTGSTPATDKRWRQDMRRTRQRIAGGGGRWRRAELSAFHARGLPLQRRRRPLHRDSLQGGVVALAALDCH